MKFDLAYEDLYSCHSGSVNGDTIDHVSPDFNKLEVISGTRNSRYNQLYFSNEEHNHQKSNDRRHRHITGNKQANIFRDVFRK